MCVTADFVSLRRQLRPVDLAALLYLQQAVPHVKNKIRIFSQKE